MLKKIILATFASLLSLPALAGDLASKTPATPSAWLNGYPYGTSGPYVGLFTEGGAGPVTASVPGVNSASLTTTTAGLGVIGGYAWGSKSSQFAYAIEGKAIANNFNGANAGFSMTGPMSFEITGLVWMPVSLIQSAFSSLSVPNPFASIAPFPLTPTGVTATNVQAGFGAGMRVDDATIAYLGAGSNKVWNFSPKIEFDLMEQLSNGSAIREFTEVIFQSKGATLGATQIQQTVGTKYMAGVGYVF